MGELKVILGELRVILEGLFISIYTIFLMFNVMGGYYDTIPFVAFFGKPLSIFLIICCSCVIKASIKWYDK